MTINDLGIRELGRLAKSKLLLLQQRLSLSVFVDNSAALEGVLADETREANQDGQDEQDGHNGECKDPLKGDDVSEELGNTQSSTENAQVEAHSVVLVGDEEEETIAQDGPDHDVGQDSGRQRVSVDGGSTNGEEQDIVESQRSRDDGNVDEPGGSGVSEVGS